MILTSVTQAMAQNEDNSIQIAKGVKTPFKGILMPEWQWQRVNEDLVEKDLLKKQIADMPPKEEGHEVMAFFTGALAASMVFLLTSKIGDR